MADSKLLYKDYAVRLFPEDPGDQGPIDKVDASCGTGVIGAGAPSSGAIPFVEDAIKNHGVTTIAMYGYSHGGGGVYLVSKKLANDHIQVASPFTCYIDAVTLPQELVVAPQGALVDPTKLWAKQDMMPEANAPIGTAFHLNFYEKNAHPFPRGDAINAANVQNVNETANKLTHTNDADGKGIAEFGELQDQLVASLKAHL